jgi:predicted ribosomally synthesized peptide with SipW-like signal peptide
MKTKMLMSMLVIALAAALVGGATMALFTDTATNPTNTFTAGEVDVTVGTTTLPLHVPGNMAPGDTVTGSFVVDNDGTLALKYSVTAVASGPLFNVQGNAPGNTPAELTITGGGTGTLAADTGTGTVTFSVYLPITAGNQFQNDAGNVAFTVYAVQDAHTTFSNIPAPAVTVAP